MKQTSILFFPWSFQKLQRKSVRVSSVWYHGFFTGSQGIKGLRGFYTGSTQFSGFRFKVWAFDFGVSGFRVCKDPFCFLRVRFRIPLRSEGVKASGLYEASSRGFGYPGFWVRL